MPDRAGAPPILVVDDNAVNRKVAALLVQQLGHEVEVAESGAAALAMVAAGPYALVLMDCQMPEMDGFAAAAAIRQDRHDPPLPIVALTAHTVAEVREHDVDGVFDDVIEKPIRLEELGDVIRRWVS
jgi:CheY-like chemotaxis protein